MLRLDFILGRISIPATKGVSRRNGKHVILHSILIAAQRINYVRALSRVRNRTIVRMVSYLNRSTRYVAINMIAVRAVILYSVPNNLNLLRVKTSEQLGNVVCRGIGLVCGISRAVPVFLGEETKVFRLDQIAVINAVDIKRAAFIRNLLTFCGQIAFVTGSTVRIQYAAIRRIIRQIISLALACTARRSAKRRHKDEVHCRIFFGFRVNRVNLIFLPLCVQSQVCIRHRAAIPLLGACFISIPTL